MLRLWVGRLDRVVDHRLENTHRDSGAVGETERVHVIALFA